MTMAAPPSLWSSHFEDDAARILSEAAKSENPVECLRHALLCRSHHQVSSFLDRFSRHVLEKVGVDGGAGAGAGAGAGVGGVVAAASASAASGGAQAVAADGDDGTGRGKVDKAAGLRCANPPPTLPSPSHGGQMLRIQIVPVFMQRSVAAVLASCWGKISPAVQQTSEAALAHLASSDAAIARLLTIPGVPASLRSIHDSKAATSRLALLGASTFGKVAKEIRAHEARWESLAKLEREAAEKEEAASREAAAAAAACGRESKRGGGERGGEGKQGEADGGGAGDGEDGQSRKRRKSASVEEEINQRQAQSSSVGGHQGHGDGRGGGASTGGGGGEGKKKGSERLAVLEEAQPNAVALGALRASLEAMRVHAGKDALPKEVYQLFESPQLDKSLELAGLCTVADEVLLLIVGELVNEATSQRQVQSLMRSVLLARVLKLTQPASRALLAAILKTCKEHPRAAINYLVMPLLRLSDVGSAQVEVVNRIIKEGLQEPPKQQLLSAILDMHRQDSSRPYIHQIPQTREPCLPLSTALAPDQAPDVCFADLRSTPFKSPQCPLSSSPFSTVILFKCELPLRITVENSQR